MNVSVPFSAPAFEPVHGASRKSIFFSASSFAMHELSSGETVLQSTTTNPACAPCTNPFGPRMTLRDIAVSPTQRKTHSLSLPTASGESQNFAPTDAASCLALLWLCDQTDKVWPAPANWRAIGPPMIPNPRNPSFAMKRSPPCFELTFHKITEQQTRMHTEALPNQWPRSTKCCAAG